MVNENKSETGTATNKNTTVVAVNSKGEPVNAQGQVIAPVKQTGGGSSSGVQAPNPDDVNIKQFLAGAVKETEGIDEKQKARIQKAADLTKALDSINNTEKFTFNNIETGEVIGTKFKYKPDEDGKTVYDYAKDEDVAQHITFVIPEDDPQDCTLITKAVSFFWNKPTF